MVSLSLVTPSQRPDKHVQINQNESARTCVSALGIVSVYIVRGAGYWTIN